MIQFVKDHWQAIGLVWLTLSLPVGLVLGKGIRGMSQDWHQSKRTGQ